MTQQYLQTLTDLLNQEGLDTRTTTVEVPSPWWTASGRSPPTRPWWTPCWEACSPRGRPSPACWRRAPPDRLSPPRPANGPSPGGRARSVLWTGPRRAVWAARLGRLGRSAAAVVAAAGAAVLLFLHPRQGAGGKNSPQGSGSGGRSRRDPRPRPRPRLGTPGWACSSRTWG